MTVSDSARDYCERTDALKSKIQRKIETESDSAYLAQVIWVTKSLLLLMIWDDEDVSKCAEHIRYVGKKEYKLTPFIKSCRYSYPKAYKEKAD